MKLIADMAPDDVLREYFAEKRRRESPPSLSGIDPDAPREKAPPSGRYEELIGLTRGCDPRTLLMMFEASSGYMIGSWACPHDGCYQSVQHKHSDVLDKAGNPLVVGGHTVTIAVTTPVPSAAVAKRHGLHPQTYKAMAARVLAKVAENMGRVRGTDPFLSGPTLAELAELMGMKGRAST